MPERSKHIGVDSFFVGRDKLLAEYDAAKKHTADDPVKTDHGVAGEAFARTWLESFLPKRFGVCKGYIITTNVQFQGDLDEWDIIVYDAIESPILYTRGAGTTVASEVRRAIPVEYVRAVVEVKATLTPSSADELANKLLRLKQYIGANADGDYPLFLSDAFFCAGLFFETKVQSLAEYRRALDNICELYKSEPAIPFIGALVLRSQRNAKHSGDIHLTLSDQTHEFPEVAEMSSPFQFADGTHGSLGTLGWGVNSYPMFLSRLLDGLRRKRTITYGLDFEDVEASRLFS